MNVSFYDKKQKRLTEELEIKTNLDSFTIWWLNNRPFMPPHVAPLDLNKNLHGAVLFRQGNMQVQIITVKPDSRIIEHRHPNVDTYEIFFSGEHALTMNQEPLYSLQDLQIEPAKVETPDWLIMLPPGFGVAVQIAPEDWHSVLFGKKGGCFLSIQEWLNGVQPTSVGHDWVVPEGQPAPLTENDKAIKLL